MRYFFVVLLLLVGCRNNTTEIAAPKKSAKNDGEQTQIAVDIFRQGGDLPQYRDSLNLLGATMTRPDVAAGLVLKPEQRTLFVDVARLTPTEVQEIEANYFRPIDAAHVASAILFRDASRSLEVPGLSELDQAVFALDWAMRRVLLYEQQPEGVPPTFVLRAGYGSATDRGLVALSLLRQFRVDGCLLIAPGMRDAPLLGLLVNKELYLFDTRLGRAVPGPVGKGIATWNDVVKQPDLLKVSKLTAEQIAQLEGRMAAPLEALAPRMKHLDSVLQTDESAGDRLVTYFDADAVRRGLQKAGLAKVEFWAPSLRSERGFTAVQNGGTVDPIFVKRASDELVPWPPVVQRYHELRILLDLPTEAQGMLLKMTDDLFEKFYRQPSEMLIRGKTESLPRRLDRIRGVLDEEEFAASSQDQLPKQAAAWRQRVNEAYLAKVHREPDGAAKVQAIWEEDQYLLYLLQADVDETPRGVKKTALTRLVLAAMREPLLARVNWLFASLAQDKAERAHAVWQVQKSADKENKSTAANARNAWLNARGAWTKYLDRNNTGPAAFAANAPELRRLAASGDFHRALTLWEYLHRELHRYAAARMEQARAMKETGQNPNDVLEQLAHDFGQLQDDTTLAKERAAAGDLFSRSPEGQRRWALLMRDWGPDGNLAWVIEAAKLTRAGYQ